MPKTKRVQEAQDALDAAIKEFIAASNEARLADAQRLEADPEEIQMLQRLRGSFLTHWVVTVSRTYWDRDHDDPEDTQEYPVTIPSVAVRDDTMPGWMVAGLLRRGVKVVEEQ